MSENRIKDQGDYEGVVEAAFYDEKLTFKCKVNTPNGYGYPSGFLLNKDGGQNTESVEFFKKAFGWDGEQLDGLVAAAKGKKVKFYAKHKGDYLNFYFPMFKPVDKDAARLKWGNVVGVAQKPADSDFGPGENLEIEEENIPF